MDATVIPANGRGKWHLDGGLPAGQVAQLRSDSADDEGMLKVDVEVTPDWLAITVQGILAGPAIAEIIREHYRKAEGKGILWDLRGADFSLFPQTEFRPISAAAHHATEEKRAWKVAYVVSGAEAYLMMCKYMMHASNSRVPVEYSVFQHLAQAQDWLREDGQG